MLSRLGCIILVAQIGCAYKSPVPVGLLSESEVDDYTKGLLDGEKDARGNPAWILSRFALPIGVGVIIAWGEVPKPPEHALLGKSQYYVRGYTYAYQKKTRAKNTNYAWAGCGCMYLFVFPLYILWLGGLGR